MKLPELKLLMKENKIKVSSYMNKPDIIAELLDRGIIFEDSVKKQEFIRYIRNNSNSVEIRNLETGEITTYPSINKASRAIECSTKFITGNNGKIWIDKGAKFYSYKIFEDSVKKQDAPVTQEIDPKYEFLRSIRNNPKSVEIRDLETGEITTYSSIYKASKAIGCSTKSITANNGKVWKNKYEIKIISVQ